MFGKAHKVVSIFGKQTPQIVSFKQSPAGTRKIVRLAYKDLHSLCKRYDSYPQLKATLEPRILKRVFPNMSEMYDCLYSPRNFLPFTKELYNAFAADSPLPFDPDIKISEILWILRALRKSDYKNTKILNLPATLPPKNLQPTQQQNSLLSELSGVEFHVQEEKELRPGILLVSHPSLPTKSVILLCAHDETGSFGLDMNFPFSKHVYRGLLPPHYHKFLRNLDYSLLPSKKSIAYYLGGPSTSIPHFLHFQEIEDATKVMDGVFLDNTLRHILRHNNNNNNLTKPTENEANENIENENESEMERIANTQTVESSDTNSQESINTNSTNTSNDNNAKLLDIMAFRGSFTWGAGQLEKEINTGFWFLASCDANFVRAKVNDKWSLALQQMGGEYSSFATLSRKK
eukprot:TRINITY_DN3636_c0_g1_i5.p1 TRINITY_DN3636_c0_g1~~TRINITY_DN3636_c0_g1_i5.p1  ORF type:complete len:403 (-),score=85.73 TRINITY_DN3636_c0_g1_i5:138-1346(-)